MTDDQSSATGSPQQSGSSGQQASQPSSPSRFTPRPSAIAAPPSAEQFTAERTTHWHQDGQPLLTTEALRAWLTRSGLVAYGPRVHQLGAPAPSWVEAVLGKKLDAEAELSGTEAARTLLTRLIADGSAVPLNLLGAAGGLGTDVPDYVASAAVFSYIFTLRGNKAWKQPPATSGAVKVSPLALATYEMLSAKVTLSAYDLATQLGKEVTETAVLRALTELWGQLRVLPVPQAEGPGPQTATMWELTTARFTKQIKAGANAGQPSALSALISLYLGQALAATEEEIETFLSPLASRSRVRDVIHALLSARQLDTVVVEGKTLLYVAGELPAFVAAVSEGKEPESSEAGSAEASGSRIKKFAAKPGSKIGTGLRSKEAGTGKPAFRAKPAFGRKPEAGDRERRPFQRESKPGFAKPRFDKPWKEERRPRPGGETLAAGADTGGGGTPAPRPEGGEAPRRTFSKPGTFGRKREGFGARPGASHADGRPPRREFGAGEGRPPRREVGDRPAGPGFKRASASAGSYPARPKRETGGKPGFSRDRGPEGENAGESPRKVFRKFDAPREGKPFRAARPEGGGKGFAGRPEAGRPARSAERPDEPRGERPRTGFGAKPAGAKPFGKRPGGGFAKAGGPFAKFADGAKPFRKPGAPRKAAGGKPGGGFNPTKRRRPEGNG